MIWACEPVPEGPGPDDTIPAGSLKLALAPPPEGAFDVTFVRFELSRPGEAPQQRDVAMGGEPPEAAWLVALRPGEWHVEATPLNADRRPSGFCLGAEGNAQVRPGATATLRLRMPCEAEGVGAIDIGAELVTPPHIREVEVLQGSSRLCLGQALGLQAEIEAATEPTVAWSVEGGAHCLRTRGPRLAFAASEVGTYTIQLEVTNESGSAELAIPVEVRDCEGVSLCGGETTLPLVPDGEIAGECACEGAAPGEPIEARPLAGELVVVQGRLQDGFYGQALADVGALPCGGGTFGEEASLDVAQAGILEIWAESPELAAIALLDAGGEVVDCIAAEEPEAPVRIARAVTQGRYTVQVRTAAPAPYGLQTRLAGEVPPVAPGDIVQGTTAEGVIRTAPCVETRGNAAVFALALPEGDAFRLGARLPNGGDVALWVENFDGEAMMCADDSEGAEPWVDVVLPPGNYRVYVAAKQDEVPENFELVAGAGREPLVVRFSSPDVVLPEAEARGEFVFFTHGADIVRLQLTDPEVRFLQVTGQGDEPLVLPLDMELGVELPIDALLGSRTLVGLDADALVRTRGTLVDVTDTFTEAPDGLTRSGPPTNTLICGPRARYDVEGLACVPCGPTGFRDPDDGTVCDSCPPPLMVRWSYPNEPENLSDFPSLAARPVCACPPSMEGQPGACEEKCPEGEYWDGDLEACTTYPEGDPGADDDGDGLDNATEAGLGTDRQDRDTDNDGMDDGVEHAKGSDPLDADSDGDTLQDGYEYWTLGSDPTNPDTDGDGLTDAEEANSGTSLTRADTDADGLDDGDELNVWTTRPEARDTDGDLLTDCEEVQAACFGGAPVPGWRSSNPRNPDSDGDTVLDVVERQRRLDPLSPDTDGDGIRDDVELRLALNGFSAASNDADGDGRIDNDADGDGLTDRQELVDGFLILGRRVFSAPYDRDTDRDGISDASEVNGWERQPGQLVVTDPSRADSDGDGLLDGNEWDLFTDPSRADTDGDGLSDGEEVRRYGTDPLDADTDGDGLTDRTEVAVSKTDPTDADSDGDGLDDGVDPNPLQPPGDTDGDGLTDAAEAGLGLNPNRADSDSDGLSDYQEVKIYSTWPLANCPRGNAQDCDGDGLYDGFEVHTVRSSARNTDTDLDGFSDYDEWAWTGSSARVLTGQQTFRSQPAHIAPGGYKLFGGTAFPPNDAAQNPDPRGLAAVVIASVSQGEVGNCWFMAAMLANVAAHPTYVRDLITELPDGTYRVKLYRSKNLDPVYVHIDAQFPLVAGTTPKYANIRTTAVWRNINGVRRQVWVPVLFPALLEKAAAVMMGYNYENLWGSSAANLLTIGYMWRGHEMFHGMHVHWSFLDPGRAGVYGSWLNQADLNGQTVNFSTFLPAADCAHASGRALIDSHVYAYTGTSAAGRYQVWNPWNSGNTTLVGNQTPQEIAHCFLGGSISTRLFNGVQYFDRPATP